MNVYYRFFWQDIQFESIEMKKKREKERKKKWISGSDGGGGAFLCQTYTQITINSNTHRATDHLPSRAEAVITFFLSFQVEAAVTAEAPCSL